MYRENIPPYLQLIIAAFLGGSYVLAFFTASGRIEGIWLLLPVLLLLLLPFVLHIASRSKNVKRIVLICLSIIYMLVGYSSLHFIAYSDTGTYSPRWILFTFYFLWIYDSMAFVSGRLLGKHPVWPSVSPGKTWEGSIGGAIFTITLAIIFSRFMPVLSSWEWIGFAIIVVLFGSLGDFFESWMKRTAGVKDSGRILPGHGGILDRLDSLLLSAPFITLYLLIIL